MTANGVDQKPSQTALFAALRRALAYKDYHNDKFGPDYLAESFLPFHFKLFLRFQKTREYIKNKLDIALPGLNEFMIARTVHFDHYFSDALQNQFPQIVLLGAGYDTRAYRFANLNQNTRIFELDAAPTQTRKISCLQKAGVALPPQVNFVPIDFNKEALGTTLENAGYAPLDKTLFIWEGVTYYLDQSSVEATLAFFRDHAQPESILGFDFITSTTGENDSRYGIKEFTQTMQAQHANEALTFSLADEEIESFLMDQGVKVVACLNNQEIEQRYLLDENKVLIGPMTSHFRFVTVSKK